MIQHIESVDGRQQSDTLGGRDSPDEGGVQIPVRQAAQYAAPANGVAAKG